MFSYIKNRFRSNPKLYYSMSIAATWAGVGSLMMGIQMAQDYGIVPFLLWALGNTAACIVFGIFAPMIPKLRDVFRSKIMRVVVGLMCPFQVWISLNGISAVFADTPVGEIGGKAIAYAAAIFYVIILWKRGMIRNVLTDHASWVAVYVLAFCLTVAAYYTCGGGGLSYGLEADNLRVGLSKCVLLIPGAFLYPYFFEILDYNDGNEDGTEKINVRQAFINGGLLFGGYLFFTFAMAFTSFSPILNIVKAVLITLIAISSLSSFQYSLYITFGRPVGLAVNIATIIFWPLVVSMGVMGVWTMMASIRIVIVGVSIAAAFLWYFHERRKAVRL